MKKFALPSLWEVAITVRSIKKLLRSTEVPHIGLDFDGNPVPCDSPLAIDEDTFRAKSSGNGIIAESRNTDANGSSDT